MPAYPYFLMLERYSKMSVNLFPLITDEGTVYISEGKAKLFAITFRYQRHSDSQADLSFHELILFRMLCLKLNFQSGRLKGFSTV